MMLKNRLPLFSLFLLCFCLFSQTSLADDPSKTLKSENDRLLELEAILLGQLERGDDPSEEKINNTDASIPAPAIEQKPVSPIPPQVINKETHVERVTEQLRKENARLEREIMELNASIHSLQQALRENEAYSRRTQNLAWQPNNALLTVEVVKSPTVLRISPSRNASRIYSVNAGQRLSVTHREGNWYLVQGASGVQAWLPREDVVEVN